MFSRDIGVVFFFNLFGAEEADRSFHKYFGVISMSDGYVVVKSGFELASKTRRNPLNIV